MRNKCKMYTAKDVTFSHDWKNKNKEYLKQLQKFFDLLDNIEDENLRKQIVYQMLKCDETLTKIMEEICANTLNEK